MPKENKQRGRNSEKKRKRDQYEKDQISLNDHNPAERLQIAENGGLGVQGDAGVSLGQKADQEHVTHHDTPFYGLLDQQEQEYYASVNAKLEVNNFASPEEKALFLDAVYRESQGKELKIASSQSCSRYLEKVIRISSVEQVRKLFGKFVSHFLHLVQHRFASHCCEALFLKAAQAVGKDSATSGQDATMPTLEQLFLTVVDELQPNLGYLLTERFASHVVRVLLLVLSGEPLYDVSTTSVLASRKKEKIEGYAFKDEDLLSETREVPHSFNDALSKVISSCVSSLDTTYMRALATHPTGNPILQLLLRLELMQGGKSKAKDPTSVMHRLVPDEPLEEDTESAKFIQGLLYDPTGSRLLETIIQHARGKMFKKLYGSLLKQRISVMAKNDIASYVAIRILERLSKEDLQKARDQIVPEMSTLVARNRLAVIKVLVERCGVRNVNLMPIVSALTTTYGDDPSQLLLKMLNLIPAAATLTQPDSPLNEQSLERVEKAANIHGSLLAQALLHSPLTFDMVHRSLQSMPNNVLLRLAKDSAASRVIQQALSSPCSSVQSNRKLVPKFYGHMVELAMDVSGSHLADVLWYATNGSHFMKERLAQELRASESQIRESRYGRTVWKNWSMDIYDRKSMEWQDLAKGKVEQAKGGPATKSALELARERFASQRTKSHRSASRSNTVSAHA